MTEYFGQMVWWCEHAGCVRVFDKPDAVPYIDNYVYSLPFIVQERFEEPEASGRLGFIELTCVTTAMTPSVGRAIYETVIRAGWGLLSTRVKDGEKKTIEVTRIYWDRKEYEAQACHHTI